MTRITVVAILCCVAWDNLPAQDRGDQSPPRVYFEYEVQAPVSLIRGPDSRPVYPPTLKAAKVEGSVPAQFVVDTSGVVDLQSFKVFKSPNPLFVEAVRAYLPHMHFVAAKLDGHKVKQLVQQSFVFSLPK